MNTKDIKDLIEILEHSNLQSLSYKDKVFEISLVKGEANKTSTTLSGHVVKSPLVGIFYTKPQPDASPYTQVGNRVNQGDVLGIIESMKVMNEIKAPQAGVVAAIHINDGDTVDFDQPLFTLK